MKKSVVIGIILTICLSPLFRGLFFSFEASVFFTLISVLSATYFLLKLSQKEAIHTSKWLMVSGILLLAAYGLSFIKAVNVRENIDTLIQYIEYLIVAVVLYDYFIDRRALLGRSLMLTSVFVGFTSAVIGLEAYTGSFSVLNYAFTGIGSVFQYKNTVSIYYAVCLIFLLSLINLSSKSLSRILLSGIGSAIIISFSMTGSKGGYLVGTASILLFMAMQPKAHRLKTISYFICIALPSVFLIKRVSLLAGSYNYLSMTKYIIAAFGTSIVLGLAFEVIQRKCSQKRLRALLAVSISFAVVAAAIIFLIKGKSFINSILPQNILERLTSFDLNNMSFVDRVSFNKDAFKLISANWLLGLGGGGWPSLYQSVQETFYIAKAVHNHYLQVFVEAGILGFLSFISIVLLSIYHLFRSLFKNSDSDQKIYVAGFACGFLALAVHSAIDFNLSFPSISLLFWVLIALSALCSAKRDKKVLRPSLIPQYCNIAFVAVCAILLSVNALYATAAYDAEKGLYSIDKKNYAAARFYYEQANELDPINAVYTFQLTKLYNLYADKTEDKGSSSEWRKKAQLAAEKSIILNRCYPTYLEVLAATYFKLKEPLKALESVETLIRYQPCNNRNYELLARGYLEAAQYLIDNNSPEKARELLISCSKIDTLPHVLANRTILTYQKNALKLLGNK